jgi:hypothetical protein
MVKELRKQKRTNIFIVDEEAWAWAQYRAKLLGFKATSEYVFKLIELDKKNDVLKAERRNEKDGKTKY